ncbi:MAG: XAC2610-related protein [Hyphomicrobiales bacterium]
MRSLSGIRNSAAVFIFASCAASAPDVMATMTLDGTNCVRWGGERDGDLVRCVGELGGGQKLSVSLYGKQPNKVTNIIISLDGGPPMQNIALNAEPIIDHMNVGMIFADMNFDGFTDIAVMISASKPGGQRHVHFLYDKQSKKYFKNKKLSEISPVKLEPQQKHLFSKWRKSTTLSGRDTYEWRNSALVMTERRVRYDTGANCEERLFKLKDGKLDLAEAHPCD